jgi:phage shock protein PspC (stress-responsive transcriptional regulator)
MAGNENTGSSRPYNVVASFASEREATTAVERLTGRGVPRSAIALQGPGRDPTSEEAAGLRAEMQEEVTEGFSGPSFFLIPATQAKGAFFGALFSTVVGAIVGLAAGLAWAYAMDSTLSRPIRILLLVFFGAMGGGTVGFLAGGIHNPRREAARDPQRPRDDRRLVSERNWLVAVHAGESEIADQAAAVLQELGAERVDLVDASGTPLPPQAEHPRPADPPKWWWRRAGHG